MSQCLFGKGAKMKWAENRKETIADRIMRCSIPEPNSGCWIWMAALSKSGHGHLHYRRQWQGGAHRASYEAFCGKIPPGLWVCHRCNTPACVNPEHLYLGTVVENTNDRMKAGTSMRGERHHDTPFTEKDVIAIRQSPESGASLARRLGVSRQAINKIKARKTWAHVEENQR